MSLQRIQGSDATARRVVRVVALLLLAAPGPRAFGLGLGEPNVASVLGQPLQMTVPLVMERGVELTQDCVRIIPGKELGEPIPSLNAGRITIDNQGRQLRIESLQPIIEPTLRVVVELGCNDRVRREFAVLLDPPIVATPVSEADASGRAGRTEPALGLGMAQISAVLGQRLSLKVPVVGTDAGSLSADCVHLADPISSEGAPVLRQADIRVLPQDTGALIEVATKGPVTEPAVRLALDVGCREPLRREYAILLGLPTLAASNAEAAPTAPEAQAPEPVAKPEPKPVAKAPRIVTAVPVAPASAQDAGAPGATAGKPAEARRAKAGSDRLVLGSPDEQAKPALAGTAAPDANAELLKRLDMLSRQIEDLQAQLTVAQHQVRDLEQQRRALEAREEARAQWTWSLVGLGVVLMAGGLLLAWRHWRAQAQPAWEPVVTRAPPVAVVKPASATHTSTTAASREAPEIGGRGTMPPAPNTTGGVTEPPLTDNRHTEITVTELHDTVQVIKELYASVLDRNTTGAPGGRPQRPLELDLRAPTGMNPPAVKGGRLTAPPGKDALQPAQGGGAEKQGPEERFTELPTEVGLDLDLSTAVAAQARQSAAPTEALVQWDDDRRPAQTGQQRTDAAPPREPTPVEPAAAEPAGAGPRASDAAVLASADPQPPATVPHKVPGPGAFPEENLTQTPTEMSIDIDVGATTDFASTVGRAALRVTSAERTEAGRAKGAASALDLQLDLNQPELNSKQRVQRSA